MAGYTRNDTGNNIANGNVIDADDLDGEFNAIETAFGAVTGHTHGGTAGDGAPITRVGPAQDLVVSATQVLPKTTNTLDLGSAAFKFKDAYVDGVLFADGINYNGTVLTVTGAQLNALSGLTASVTELNYTDGVTSSIQTQLNAKQNLDAELTALAGLTSAADQLPYFSGVGTAALTTLSSFGRTLIDDVDAAAARTTLALGTMATQAASAVSITGGSITGITDLAVADGGTGVGTITGIIRGNGTSPFTAAVAGTDFLAPAAIGVTVQAFDADLSAVAGLATNGLIARTGAGTAAVRSVASGTGITVTNGDGVAGNPTVAVTGNLSSLAGLSLVNGDVLVATGANTVARLGIGTAGQVLQVNGGATAPQWATPASPAGHVLLGTITTTSGTSQTLGSLTLTGYTFLILMVNGVSFTAANGRLTFNSTAGPFCSAQVVGAAGVLHGEIKIDLNTGAYGSTVTADDNITSLPRGGNAGITTASTSITVAVQSALANFDAGSIRVYGVL